jgi:hypothetical protein
MPKDRETETREQVFRQREQKIYVPHSSTKTKDRKIRASQLLENIPHNEKPFKFQFPSIEKQKPKIVKCKVVKIDPSTSELLNRLQPQSRHILISSESKEKISPPPSVFAREESKRCNVRVNRSMIA